MTNDATLGIMRERFIALTNLLGEEYHLKSEQHRIVVKDILNNVSGLWGLFDEEEKNFFEEAVNCYENKSKFQNKGITKEKYQQDAVVETDSDTDNLSD